MLFDWIDKIQCIIPHPVASEHRWLVKAPWWIHSVPDVWGRRSRRCSCHARLWNLHDVTNKKLFALPIDKASSVEAQIELLWRSFCPSSYRDVGLMRMTPRGWIQIGESRWEVARESRLGVFRCRIKLTFPNDRSIYILWFRIRIMITLGVTFHNYTHQQYTHIFIKMIHVYHFTIHRRFS